MIPFRFRLRKAIRFRYENGSCLVISEMPLNIVRVARKAARIIQLCDGNRTLEQIARETGIEGNEEQIFRVCDYFSKRGILEMEPGPDDGSYMPFVTVIIPSRDRQSELVDCLKSVFAQDYPQDRMEVIVIDDGSTDDTRNVVDLFPCRLISHKSSRGQSYCRNLGAKEAKGEILAFIDSDCVAARSWIRELVPPFQWDRVGAVGGYVDGYFETTGLDRYEKACSSLNMGNRVIHGTNDNSSFYVPTCNLLVRKTAYNEAMGITESLHVGEDVDFCWRLRKRGHDIFYLPRGRVRHKHRNHLWSMLRRRADYGTSEALLHSLHKEKRKLFQLPPLAAITFLASCSVLLFFSAVPLLLIFIGLGTEIFFRMKRIGRTNVSLSVWTVCSSAIRSHFAFSYFISFHLIRYYLLPLLLFGIWFHPVWYLGLFMLVVASSVDYHTRRPSLGMPRFLCYYLLEHLFYQFGVFIGCLREKTFGSYTARFVRRGVEY